MKRNVIMTSSDEKYGDFLINHWLKSLTENVDLADIDVVILDYGLNASQRRKLESTGGVRVVRCKRDGMVVVIRFRDMLRLLARSEYDQVMSCDGGDIIFQKDISHLFKEHKKEFRAVCDEEGFPYNQMLVRFQDSIDEEFKQDIKRQVAGKKGINGGVILAPRTKFMRLCKLCNSLIRDSSKYGPDQLVVNYLFYKEGFVRLRGTYNFLICAGEAFAVKDGKIYDKRGGLAAIVHNAGRISFARIIKNFGYGKGYNRVNYVKYYLFRTAQKAANLFYPLRGPRAAQ